MSEGATFNWDVIARKLDNEPAHEDDSGNMVKELYLGSILSLSPSGKYYTPWANSNVDEEEAEEDEAWGEKLEAEAAKHGLYVTSGEGDPTDLFVGKVVPKRAARASKPKTAKSTKRKAGRKSGSVNSGLGTMR